MRDYFSVFINNISGAQLDIFFFQGVINIGEIIQIDIDNQPGGMRPPVYRTACGNIIDFLTALVLQGLYIEVAVYIAPRTILPRFLLHCLCPQSAPRKIFLWSLYR